MSGTSYRLDETYVKVGTEWKYLYRAVDSAGNTIEFMLSAKRDVSAAKHFFRKLMRADHRRLPFTVGTDKHASYPEAFAASIKEKVLPRDCKLRRIKYLNNVIEQDHRFIRRRWRAMQCFRTFSGQRHSVRSTHGLPRLKSIFATQPIEPPATLRNWRSHRRTIYSASPFYSYSSSRT